MDLPHPILIAEDEPVSRRILVKLLTKAGYEVTAVENGREALAAFEDNFYPLVLTDWIMPEVDGLELCRTIREQSDKGYVYIILLTNMDSREDIITGLEAGADDYLTKPVYFVELVARIKNGIRILELERNLKKATQEILTLTVTDPLTSTYNRRYLNEHLPDEIEQALKNDKPLSVILCDIDHFKKVNDTFGHLTGDMDLRSLALIIRDTVNDQQDWVVRYGGEEVLIVLPGTPLEGARGLAGMVREFVAQATIKAGGNDVSITSSFGLAAIEVLEDPQKTSLDKLLHIADENLYRAKDEGRNRVVG